MNALLALKKLRHRAYIAYCRKLPIQKNKIIMWANSFKQYGCSPKYITEYICANMPNKYDIVWVFEPQVQIPDGLEKKVRIVRYFSMEYLKELHTAKVIICNMRMGDAHYWKKRREQIYLQTWHSSIRLKKIEKDAEQCFNEQYITMAKKDSEKIDLLLAGCDFSTEIFEKAFWYNGDIMKSGTPRCDILVNNPESIRDKVYNYYNIEKDMKILLYAPTFRKNQTPDLHGFDINAIQKALQTKFGGKWLVMYRFHPNIVLSFDDVEGSINASRYSDMQELLVASDILITDYSSCMFDMALTGKPCSLFAPDYEEYIRDERGLYFDMSELPFSLAKTNDELIENIINYDEKQYCRKIADFMERIGSYEDGHATERVVNCLEQMMH